MPEIKKIAIIEFPCECPHRHTFGYERYTPDGKTYPKGSYCHHNFVDNMQCKDATEFPRKCPLETCKKTS